MAGTLDANAEKRLGLFNTNQATNQGLFDSIGDIFDTRNRNVGTLENNFLGLDAGRTSDLNAALDALNERCTSTQQGISSGVFQYLANLPQNVLATQSGQLGNQQQALQSILSTYAPDFEALEAEMNLLLGREDLLFDFGSLFQPTAGIGTDQDFAPTVPIFNVGV